MLCMYLLIFLEEDSLVPEIARIYKEDGGKYLPEPICHANAVWQGSLPTKPLKHSCCITVTDHQNWDFCEVKKFQ